MSEKEDFLKSDVVKKVERIVCDCVNKVFCKDKYSPISPLSLYEGKTNIPFVKRMARPAVFVTAHDRFGVSYSVHVILYGLSECIRIFLVLIVT